MHLIVYWANYLAFVKQFLLANKKYFERKFIDLLGNSSMVCSDL